MESLLDFLNQFVTLFVNLAIVVLIFLFVIKPLLNYFIVNREIEIRKKLAREYQEAKRDSEAARDEQRYSHDADDDLLSEIDADSMVDELVEQANLTQDKKVKMAEELVHSDSDENEKSTAVEA